MRTVTSILSPCLYLKDLHPFKHNAQAVTPQEAVCPFNKHPMLQTDCPPFAYQSVLTFHLSEPETGPIRWLSK